jgi:hypothetical protein
VARPAQCRAAWFENEFNDIPWFKQIQKPPNFDWFEKYLPMLEKFEIKYGWKDYEMSNNVAYRRFLKFLMDFDPKFRELSMRWNRRKIH